VFSTAFDELKIYKVPDIFNIPPLIGKPDQQRFTILFEAAYW